MELLVDSNAVIGRWIQIGPVENIRFVGNISCSCVIFGMSSRASDFDWGSESWYMATCGSMWSERALELQANGRVCFVTGFNDSMRLVCCKTEKAILLFQTVKMAQENC